MATFDTRIKMKSDTTANWSSQPSFVPLNGELIIYTDYETRTDEHGNTINAPGIKIGDGSTYGVDLPFVGDEMRDMLLAHISNTSMHVTPLEKIFWNNKLNVTDAQEVIDNVLVLNRN